MDINISRAIDGVKKQRVLKKILYIRDLRINLFFIGRASKSVPLFKHMVLHVLYITTLARDLKLWKDFK